METLRDRVNDFPMELDAFIRQIYGSISPVYRRQTAIALLLVEEAEKLALAINGGGIPSHWLLYIEEMLQNSEFALNTAITKFDDDATQESDVNVSEDKKHRSRSELLCRRWCKDIIQIVEDDFNQLTIDFAHRMFSDFLDEIKDDLRSAVSPGFDLALTFLQFSVQDIKQSQRPSVFIGRVSKILSRHGGTYRFVIDSINRDPDLVVKLFQEIDKIGLANAQAFEKFQDVSQHWTQALLDPDGDACKSDFSLLPALAVDVGTIKRFSASASGFCLAAVALNKGMLDLFHLLAKETSDESSTKNFYLECALLPMFNSETIWPKRDVKSWLAEFVLAGADLNLPVKRECGKRYSVWQRFLYFAQIIGASEFTFHGSGCILEAQEDLSTLVGIVEALLDLGADPDVELLPGHFCFQDKSYALAKEELGMPTDLAPWLPIRAAEAFNDRYIPSQMAVAEEAKRAFAKIRTMLKNASRRKGHQAMQSIHDLLPLVPRLPGSAN